MRPLFPLQTKESRSQRGFKKTRPEFAIGQSLIPPCTLFPLQANESRSQRGFKKSMEALELERQAAPENQA